MGDHPLLDRILVWADEEPNIMAVVMTGSRASLRSPPDAWSDTDVELICDDPAPLAADDGWFHDLGDVLTFLRLSAEDGAHRTRLVVYTEGEIDFSLCGRDRITGQEDGLCDLYRRGYRVLYDPGGITAVLPQADGEHERRPLPTADEFDHAVRTFWFEAYHQAGYLGRGELWALKFRDGTMKKYLRRMLEWRALAVDPEADVRHIGRGMRRWVGEEGWRDLHAAWGGLDAASSHRATVATCVLFGRYAREVAAAFGFTYRQRAEDHVLGRVRGVEPP
jgi:aminoglycoside 6-adenylyltransferase